MVVSPPSAAPSRQLRAGRAEEALGARGSPRRFAASMAFAITRRLRQPSSSRRITTTRAARRERLVPVRQKVCGSPASSQPGPCWSSDARTEAKPATLRSGAVAHRRADRPGLHLHHSPDGTGHAGEPVPGDSSTRCASAGRRLVAAEDAAIARWFAGLPDPERIAAARLNRCSDRHGHSR